MGRLAAWWPPGATEPADEGAIVIHRPARRGIHRRALGDGAFRVVGRVAERAVALNDLTTDEAADYVQDRLRRIGVDRALARAGARDGDLVHIGELAFEWTRDQPEFTGDSGGRRRRSDHGRVSLRRRQTDGGSQDRVLLGDHRPGRVDTERHRQAGRRGGARPPVAGYRVVVVTSGAIAAGWTSLAPDQPRPADLATLQAVAAVGQHRLMQVWSDALERCGLMAGQVLMAPLDFVHRSQYLHARQTLEPTARPGRGPGGQRERRGGR